MKTGTKLLLAIVIYTMFVTNMGAADTVFTYQGELNENGALANGTFDMDFSLWDSSSAGNQVGATINLIGVQVTNGRFVVDLDFGANSFDNSARWLEIAIDEISLLPRTPITRSPYAIQTRGLFVDASENVGIGTITPNAPLHVVGGGTNVTLRATTSNPDGRGVFGIASASSGMNYGVYGRSDSDGGLGVYGLANATTGTNYGVSGESNSPDGYGIFGRAPTVGVFGKGQAVTGLNYGVWGESNSPDGYGVYGNAPTVGLYGIAESTVGLNFGVIGTSASPSGRGIRGYASALSGATYGVYGKSDSAEGTGVYGTAPEFGVFGESDSPGGTGVYGEGFLAGVYGLGNGFISDTYGVHGETGSNTGTGVFGKATSNFGETYGVRGESDSPQGIGVYGEGTAQTSNSVSNTGVYGVVNGDFGRGVHGRANSTTGSPYGVYGYSASPTGYDFFAAGPGIDYGTLSSRRWKNSIKNIENPLGTIGQLRGVYFDWDKEHGGRHDVGMIAEEVGAVLPEIVNYEENGIDAIGMDYSKLTPLLVEAVNELNKRNQLMLAAHEQEIAIVKTENEALRGRLTRLEAFVEELAARTPEKQK